MWWVGFVLCMFALWCAWDPRDWAWERGAREVIVGIAAIGFVLMGVALYI